MICQGSSFPWRNRLASSGDPPDSDWWEATELRQPQYLPIKIPFFSHLFFPIFPIHKMGTPHHNLPIDSPIDPPIDSPIDSPCFELRFIVR